MGILEARPKVGYYYSGKTLLNVIGSYIKRISVDEIKSMPVAVEENATIYDAIVTMFLEDTGNIYVTKDGYLSGIVSRKDFIKVTIGNQDIKNMPVAMIMTRVPNIVYVEKHENVHQAAMKMVEHEVDSLPLVEKVKISENHEELKILGKVSKTSITKVVAKIGEE